MTKSGVKFWKGRGLAKLAAVLLACISLAPFSGAAWAGYSQQGLDIQSFLGGSDPTTPGFDSSVFFEQPPGQSLSTSLDAAGLHGYELQPYEYTPPAGRGDALFAVAQTGQNGEAAVSASASVWWYFSTDNYRMLMPGTNLGPYSYYLTRAVFISSYMDSGYDAASAVLGEQRGDLINVWLDYVSGTQVAGLFMPTDPGSIYLNLAASSSSSAMAGVASHETTHLLFNKATHLYERDPVAESWVTESLAYYVGNTVFPYGSQYDYDFNRDLLKQYSNDGSLRASWYDSGARYNGRGTSDPSSTLDFVQLNTIGYFLANSDGGWGAIQQTVDLLGQGRSIDEAFSASYGMPTGQYDVASGPGVNTLYSTYLNYYLGHY